MKIVKNKYKVLNLKTGGIKIVGYEKSIWYKVRSKNYKVESLYESKSISAFKALFDSPLVKVGSLVNIKW